MDRDKNVYSVFQGIDFKEAPKLALLAVCVSLAACGGGGHGKSSRVPASLGGDHGGNGGAINMTGKWKVTWTTGQNDCEDEVNSTEAATLDVTQTGNSVEFKTEKGEVIFNGSLNNNVLTGTTSYDVNSNVGTLAYSSTTTVTVDSQTFTGEDTYTYQAKEGNYHCSGKETTTGQKLPSTPPSNPNPPPTDPGTNGDKEPNDSAENASPIALNSTIKGSVNTQSDAQDIYVFTVSKDGNYSIDLSDFGQNDLDIYLFDGEHNEPIAQSASDQPGLAENISFNIEGAKNSPAFILVDGYNTNGSTSQYTLKITAQ